MELNLEQREKTRLCECNAKQRIQMRFIVRNSECKLYPFELHGVMLMSTPPSKLEPRHGAERCDLGNITTLICAR
jgi:hypothetical protein